ncbi:glycoside hydrolase family 92 protein [Spirosoma aureum]|uniref:Glycoside hydrolase family 92 protein n=1 Tax=Spirosoma aureum TaxID=2692134 RepID=A0A6G9AV92_9BACT|nr:GH92 family glycosyl hydrolase [Spirosoma aureum]QIP16205.1 glycoside hydrolase family 92 protein [Spirosoma aureum]
MSRLITSFLKTVLTTVVAAISLCQYSFGQTSKAGGSGIQYIDPTIGNVAPLLNTNRPIVHLPNQMIRVFPKRQDHLDMQITDFPMLAQNIITPQMIFSIKPSKGAVTDTAWYRRLTYDHDLEVTQPWYYSVKLTDDDILTEYTAGEKTGIYRFTFPAGVSKNLLLSHYYKNGQYEFQDGNKLVGTEFVVDAIHEQQGVAYIYGVFTGKPQTGKKTGEKDWGKYTVSGTPEKPKKMDGERAWVSYGEQDSPVVEFRYAISFVSREQAKKNFEKELTSVSFDQLKAKGKAAWEKTIGQIKVEGGTEAQKRSFYTALYRCYVRMIDVNENGTYFSGYDKKAHEDKRPFYTDDYTWGNYLALHPLRTILDPKREADMLQSYVTMYQQSGWMPEYPRPFGDRPGMFGFKSTVMFLDAYRKGIRNFDVKTAFDGMLKNAEQATMLPFRNGPKGGLEDFYVKNGYYPALHPGETETDAFASLKPGQKRSAVAITLGDAYDSWALSELAKELGNQDVYKRYAPRTKNYRNLWNEKYNLFIPKDAKGDWIEIDPKFDGGHNGFDYYNENNAWSYMWNAQQDFAGLRDLMGGADKMERNLDQLFREGMDRSKPVFWEKWPNQTGMIGQFAMGNQVTFFIPYIFNFTNASWKTQKYTRLLLDTWFQDNIFGVPGDEDGGSMSSFVVFSAMGFYPTTPGIPRYSITSPLFSKVTIDLPNGKKFTLIAHNSSRTNKYIQSASMNGKPLSSLSFSHQELMDGGTLVLEMGEKTDKKWVAQN